MTVDDVMCDNCTMVPTDKLKQMQAEIERLRSINKPDDLVLETECPNCEATLTVKAISAEYLRKQLAEAKEVLGFYASYEPQTEVWDKSLLIDRGNKARALLEKWGKG